MKYCQAFGSMNLQANYKQRLRNKNFLFKYIFSSSNIWHWNKKAQSIKKIKEGKYVPSYFISSRKL